METTAQAFLFNTDKKAETTRIGAAVMLNDGYLAVAGFVGVMPSVVAEKIIDAAARAGVRVEELEDDRERRITALSWGEIDVPRYYDVISIGIAESMVKAVLKAMTEDVELEDAEQTRDDDEIPF